MSARDHEALLRRSLRELKALKSRLHAMERAATEPIAVVGIGCRFPGGADDPEAFWHMLTHGVDAVGEVPPDRWSLDLHYDPDPDAPGKMYTRTGAFVSGIDGFDADFFGISHREAATMSPQQRLLLEVAWATLEDAQVIPEQLFGTPVGVYVGACGFGDGTWSPGRSVEPEQIDAYRVTGNMLSVAAGRVSYALGLAGPSMVVDTACSSSLVAVHLACQALRARECDLALAGGVNLIVSPSVTIGLCQTKALAPDGRCKSFDAAADGFSRGEGCGLVALKRLGDAEADGDDIICLVRGTALNQDGASGGLTVPSGPSQEAVLRAALRNAGISASELDYVEAHGTGTVLGDPIEIGALASVLGDRGAERPLLVGSVKTNIGHLEAAAGIAGFIKAALALRNECIPPSLHQLGNNPHIPWDELPIEVPSALVPWKRGAAPRFAGVSSFGMSGTNAHVVLSHAPPAEAAQDPSQEQLENQRRLEGAPPAQLLTLSAADPIALSALAQRYERYLDHHPDTRPRDLCRTAATRRSHLEYRLWATGDDVESLRDALARSGEAGSPSGVAGRGRARTGAEQRVAFLFTGQGAQYAGMGAVLYRTQPRFRRTIDRCAEILTPHLGLPLHELLYPRDGNDVRLSQTAYTQPALFALEYALADLWMSWGVTPTVMIGHSVGEYVAACLAGVFDLESGLELVALRGKLMQELPAGGSMAAVFAPPEQVLAACEATDGLVEIAGLNGPGNVVVSGEAAAVSAVCNALAEDGVRHRSLDVSHAFHCALMEPILDRFSEAATRVEFAAPRIPLVSNVTGAVATEEIADSAYWVRHLRSPVRFADGLDSVDAVLTGGSHQGPVDAFYLETGPRPTLIGIAQQCLAGACDDDGRIARHWIASLRAGEDDGRQLLSALGCLHANGLSVDWTTVDAGLGFRPLRLPTYPFRHQIFPLEPDHTSHAFPGVPRTPPAKLYEVCWRERRLPEGQTATSPDERWVLVADPRGVAAALARRLINAGCSCLVLHPRQDGPVAAPGRAGQQEAWSAGELEGALSEALGNPATAVHIVFVCLQAPDESGPPTTRRELDAALESSCRAALELVQSTIRSRRAASTKIWFVTGGARAVPGDASLCGLTQATLWGLGRSLAREHRGLLGGLIDLDPEVTPAQAARDLANELGLPAEGEEIAYRSGQRFVARLSAIAGVDVDGDRWSPPEEGTYLVTGGLTGLGLEVAEWLVARGVRSLMLIGRRLPDAATSARLDRLEVGGVRINVCQADVADATELDRVVATVEEGGAILRGVVHAAGVTEDATLLHQNWPRWLAVFAAKVVGTWNLHRLTEDRPLDAFVLFSSAAGVLGSAGQANYAAANAFVEALALHRRYRGLAAVCISWGPWSEVGMSTRGNTLARLAEYGLHGFGTEAGLDALGTAMDSEIAECLAIKADWPRYLARQGGEVPLLGEVAESTSTSTAAGESNAVSFARELAQVQRGERARMIGARVVDTVALVFGRASSDEIDRDKGFFDMGLDSLMNVELKAMLEASFERVLPTSIMFDYPTVNDLSNYLLSLVAYESTPGIADQALGEPAANEEPSEPRDLASADIGRLLDRELDAVDGALADRSELLSRTSR